MISQDVALVAAGAFLCALGIWCDGRSGDESEHEALDNAPRPATELPSLVVDHAAGVVHRSVRRRGQETRPR